MKLPLTTIDAKNVILIISQSIMNVKLNKFKIVYNIMKIHKTYNKFVSNVNLDIF